MHGQMLELSTLLIIIHIEIHFVLMRQISIVI